MNEIPPDDLAWIQLVRPTLTSLVRNKEITDRDIVVYMIMRCLANYVDGHIEITKDSMATLFGMDRQKIGRAIKSLLIAGYIKQTKIKGRNRYVCIDTAKIADKRITWQYTPQEFGKISAELKKMKKTGEATKNSLIKIEQLNIQINIDNSTTNNWGGEITEEQLNELRELEKKGLLPRHLAKKLSTYQK